jgi:hypothetical protein
MTEEIDQVVCRFIGDFKVGDNLVRNANEAAPARGVRRTSA